MNFKYIKQKFDLICKIFGYCNFACKILTVLVIWPIKINLNDFDCDLRAQSIHPKLACDDAATKEFDNQD